MPIDIMYGSPSPKSSTVSEFASRLRANLESAYERVRDKNGRVLDRQKEIYDQRVHGKPFATGDLVWLHSPAVPRGQSRKLHRPWSGPYRVVSKLSEVTYRIQNTRARRQRLVVHFDCLKVCPPNKRLGEELPTTSLCAPRPSEDNGPGTIVELIDLPDDDPPIPPPTSRYPSRQRRPPNYLGEYVAH